MKARWNQDSSIHTSTTCWTLTPIPFLLSIFLFSSLYGCQTMISSEGWTWNSCSGVALHLTALSPPCPLSGQCRSPLRPVWNCLPALSALKCSLTSHPDWEAHLAATAAALHFILFTIRSLKEKDIYLLMFLYGFRPALVSDCCLVCSANISYSACGSFSITFCYVKTNDVFQKNADWERGCYLWSRRTALSAAMQWVGRI